jgi:hypothetical protein
MRYFLLGFDPAQLRDYAALSAAEVTSYKQGLLFKLVALERRQRLSYPDLVAWAVSALRMPEFNRNVTQSPELVVDSTGIGIAVRDLLVKAGIKPVAVTTTAGNAQTNVDHHTFNVGKALLVGKFLSAFDSGRFQINPNHPAYPLFERELLAFKAEISARGNAIFEATEGEHDDMISACALVTWRAETRPKPQPRLVVPRPAPEDMIMQPWQGGYYGTVL